MKHTGTKKLESERLILRRFTMEDVDAMYDNWGSDPEVAKYLMWPVHENKKVSEEVLKDWVASYEKDDYYQWAIVLKEYGDIPIGGIGAVKQDEKTAMMHVGYCIGKKWWHKGITSEALNMIIEFFFGEVGANRIEARHDPRNLNSGKVMQKCGMIYEGTFRQADWNNQGICDSSYYAILKSDYAFLRTENICTMSTNGKWQGYQ